MASGFLSTRFWVGRARPGFLAANRAIDRSVSERTKLPDGGRRPEFERVAVDRPIHALSPWKQDLATAWNRCQRGCLPRLERRSSN